MLFTRLIRKNRKPTEPNAKIVGGIILAMLAMAIIIQFFGWINANKRSLLNQADGLVTSQSAEELGVTLPTETFESELFEIGLYTQSNKIFPAGTVALVYIKDDWRFIEIDYLPGRTMEDHRAMYRNFLQEEAIVEGNTFVVVTLDNKARCIDYEDEVPNRCEVTRQLLIETESHLIMISADGRHVTDGELLIIGRSILEQN
jgi:hypothetical protein